MIIKDITYNGVDLSSGNAFNILIDESVKTSTLRTTIFNKENFHGSRSTNTLGSGRLFIFSGQVYGETFQERQIGVNQLNSLIKPEGLPSLTNRGFKELTFKDWDNKEFKVQAKVYSQCDFTHNINSPVIDFRFELYSNNYEYLGITDKEVDVSYTELPYPGFGVGFPIGFPVAFDGLVDGSIQVTNDGDFVAKTIVTIVGDIENPRIYNLTNDTNYKLGKTTTNLIIDNRERLIVTDAGEDATPYRQSGSTGIFLDPGVNNLIIFGDNPDASIDVTIGRNDTYSGS